MYVHIPYFFVSFLYKAYLPSAYYHFPLTSDNMNGLSFFHIISSVICPRLNSIIFLFLNLCSLRRENSVTVDSSLEADIFNKNIIFQSLKCLYRLLLKIQQTSKYITYIYFLILYLALISAVFCLTLSLQQISIGTVQVIFSLSNLHTVPIY